MTVYVDQFPGTGWDRWNGGGHMLGTDLDELHEMARRIGMRRSWFQTGRFAHYDLTAPKRKLAVAAGAVEIAFGELPEDVLMRSNGGYEPRSAVLARRAAQRDQPDKPPHRITKSDMFASEMTTLVNPINCAGAMGAGLAKEFKRRYPDMNADYVQRCRAGQVKLGEPYLWAPSVGDERPSVINFPTKQHWRDSSSLEPIRAGLQFMCAHLAEWQVRSVGIPALGCGLGGLPWEEVRPVMVEHLKNLPIPVLIFAPR